MIDYEQFTSISASSLQADYPSNEEMGVLLQTAANTLPGYAEYFSAGSSVDGRPLHGLLLTDKEYSDDHKSQVVLAAAEHGTEKNAAMVLLLLIRELTETPVGRQILQHQKLVLLPVVNPDGYDHCAFTNRNGVNLFADFHFDRPPSQPEAKILAEILDRFMPELFVSVHGHCFDQNRLRGTESTGIAFTTRTTRCYSRELVELANQAAEEAGFPQDRGEEDSQRILPEILQAPYHSFESFDRLECTSPLYAYHRCHSLSMSMEVMHNQSGVIRLMALLKAGERTWDGMGRGYPAWVVNRANHLFLVPGGKNLSACRVNRIRLWQRNFENTLFYSSPEQLGFFFGGASCGIGLLRELHELSSKPYRVPPSCASLRQYLEQSVAEKYQFSSGHEAILAESEAAFTIEPSVLQMPDQPSAGEPPEMALLFRMPANSRIVSCSLAGRATAATEFSLTRTDRYLWIRIPLPINKNPISSFAIHYQP